MKKFLALFMIAVFVLLAAGCGEQTHEQAGVTTDGSSAGTTDQQPAATTEPNPAATTEQKPAATTEQKPAATTEQKPAATTEQKPAATTEQKPAATTEQKPAATTEPNPFDGQLDDGFLTADDIESAVSSAKTDYPENTADNLFNGLYEWQLKGVAWVGGGLKTEPVSADITLKTPATINKIALTPRSARPYKMIISLSSDGENYTPVVDTTQAEFTGAELYKWTFDPVENVKYIRLTVTGLWGKEIDWVTINELYIYPA